MATKTGISKAQETKFWASVEKALDKIVTTLGKETMQIAQSEVPVITGQLRNSGKMFTAEKNAMPSFQLVYEAPYAYDVHEGDNTTALTTNWQAFTRKHKRKTPSGKIVNVKAHTKVYKLGYKPVKVQANGLKWIAKDVNATRQANQWMQRAGDIVYSKQDKSIKQFLPKHLEIVMQ